MWVLTIFENDNVRMFQFETKEEAEKALEATTQPAIISYTTLSLAA
ncbi:hypothetical protein SAMN05880501_1148 [Ureibacillus xyleni]|uniref:Uncharacterized protein n=1 Tax=Ureibacillus xyleni TaxID=614648 RepID=A0A285TJN2_9BACL|nr:hypothetical protein [Ureibacillus xyleni]SOC22375.1 hypothetical protein SAMN05880501_1148 [Ureibacillus xyleni]